LAGKRKEKKAFEHTLIKSPEFFNNFKKLVIGAKVINVERRAKNILINLNNGYTILIHLKMTGHLIYGDYVYDKKINPPAGGWLPHKNERISLHDPYNRFVHVVFTFNNKKHLAFCDSRKFGKVTILETKDAHNTIHLKGVGPEPLEENFTFTMISKMF
jgi:formamidopyrimidine-DNA glycosylase